MANIPPNDPSHPRWLLDIEEWVVRDYRDIEHIVLQHGYGIISYTWGRWAVEGQKPRHPPKGIQWELPFLEVLPLDHARNVISRMGMRFVWWDWMCVPQGKKETLSQELSEAAGEEVAKQM